MVPSFCLRNGWSQTLRRNLDPNLLDLPYQTIKTPHHRWSVLDVKFQVLVFSFLDSFSPLFH